MSPTRLENTYRSELVKRIEMLLPDCVVIKLDPNEYQGIPDLLILFEDKWAMLEVKRSSSEPSQPNQPYYVELFNGMSFAAFIYPENEEEIMQELVERLGGS